MLDKTRNFALIVNDNEIGMFKGKSPRQAALKVASKGYDKFDLRETGTEKRHIYSGERVRAKTPPESPVWLGDFVWKSNVKKLGIWKPDKSNVEIDPEL